jgi:hypothetical protein
LAWRPTALLVIVIVVVITSSSSAAAAAAAAAVIVAARGAGRAGVSATHETNVVEVDSTLPFGTFGSVH